MIATGPAIGPLKSRHYRDGKAGRFQTLVPAAVVFGIVLIVAVWGSRRVATSEWTRVGDPIRVGLIQGNIDQGEKWNPARASAIFQDYLNMTRRAIQGGAELVMWPESSTPFLFEEDLRGAEQVRETARQAGVTMLFGSDQIEWRVEGNKRIADKFFNSAFPVRPTGPPPRVPQVASVPFARCAVEESVVVRRPSRRTVGPFSEGNRCHSFRRQTWSAWRSVTGGLPESDCQFVSSGATAHAITNDAWFAGHRR